MLESDLFISRSLAAGMRDMIEQTRGQVSRVVNVGMILLYCRIGKQVQDQVTGKQQLDHGKKIVISSDKKLESEFGPSFSARIHDR